MAANLDAIPAVQPALPSETSHGRYGSAHDAKHITAYQQAAAHPHTREPQPMSAAAEVILSRADKTDKDGKGRGRDAHQHDSAQNSAQTNGVQGSDNDPAAIVSISPAARAAIMHEAPTTQ